MKSKPLVEDIQNFAQNIVDTVREPLLMLDTTLRVHSANRAFYQTFQVSAEETENNLIYELGNGQWDIPALRTLLEDIIPQKSVFNDFELEHDFPTIGRKVMLLNARQMKSGSHGELLVLAMEDVTQRRRAEEALLQAGALQSAIFNSANFSSIATDAKGVIQIFNVGAERMLGYAASEVMNKITPADISDPQEVILRAATLSSELGTPITPGFEALVFKAARGIEDIYELTYIRKDGSRFPAVVSVTALRDVQDMIIGYLLIGTDNTARKRVEEEQRKLDQRLRDQQFYTRSLIESNIDALMTTDPRGIITDVNKQMEALTGCTRDELIGAPFKNYFTNPERAEAGINLVLNEKKLTDYELTVRSRDGAETVVSYNATTFYDRDRKLQGVFAAARDVTERKRAEQSLQESNIELERAIAAEAKARETAESANRTKSLFLANMSHELRTPLNAILGYSEMLQEEAEDQNLPDFLPDLQEIHGAGKHLLSLINDILDLSKIEAGKMELYLETFSVPNLIDEVVKTISPLVEANANTLRVFCPADLGTMRADITKMRQSLFNLLSNAAKFTKEGDISLEVSREMMEGHEWIQFRITDTGIGMTEDQLIKLFQTFTQADTSTTRKFGGSGLGLALTRRFCQMMGGDVTVKSVPGESSTFTIEIPAIVMVSEMEHFEPDVVIPVATSLKPQAVAIVGNVSEVEKTLPPVGSSVLVIDDDLAQRELMRRFLTGEGYFVQTAKDGKEGLRLARLLLPVAITLDVMMPGLDGWTVLSTLKADPAVRDIPVIMLTMMDDKKRGYALGAADYTTKPVDRKRLLQILKKYSCPHPPCPVLLVEDDATTRNMMRSMLEKAGWAVIEAENGRVALERVAANRPVLILLDLMMPEVDGFEFAAEIHRHPEWRSIPIVVLTAKHLTDDELLQLSGHVHQILDKGGRSREELMHEVRDLLVGWAVPSLRTGHGETNKCLDETDNLKAGNHV
jgi:PAS domain S-box-containing protein